ncbi:hypothetical protein BG011_008237 [Mortierella polycephala]|uniref:Uncharacterized protein n=1 Tax=Mortierella polycephala TaxID=41804 RepID=A0A9P6U8H3_9FUNG|nr:hypothetical protein BG011_008237 [Mortierella polycephala]
MKSPSEDTEILNGAIQVILDILELNKQGDQDGGMDRDAATTFREMIVDVFQLFQCVNSLLGQCPENKRFLRSKLKTIKDLGEHLFQEQEIPLQLDILGILFRISPTKKTEREAFAKENFSNELAAIFLEMRAENFAILSRKFLLAAQKAKPKALFGWTLVSDSVQSSIVTVPKAKEYLVDFNLSSIHISPRLGTVPVASVHPPLVIQYNDIFHWTLDGNMAQLTVRGMVENPTINIALKRSSTEVGCIQRTMEAALVSKKRKTSQPIKAVSLTPTASTVRNDMGQSGSIRHRPTSVMNMIPEKMSPTTPRPTRLESYLRFLEDSGDVEDHEDNKENIPPTSNLSEQQSSIDLQDDPSYDPCSGMIPAWSTRVIPDTQVQEYTESSASSSVLPETSAPRTFVKRRWTEENKPQQIYQPVIDPHAQRWTRGDSPLEAKRKRDSPLRERREVIQEPQRWSLYEHHPIGNKPQVPQQLRHENPSEHQRRRRRSPTAPQELNPFQSTGREPQGLDSDQQLIETFHGIAEIILDSLRQRETRILDYQDQVFQRLEKCADRALTAHLKEEHARLARDVDAVDTHKAMQHHIESMRQIAENL